jgi:uncharacterized membrane protein YbhN (UPF0104 family)
VQIDFAFELMSKMATNTSSGSKTGLWLTLGFLLLLILIVYLLRKKISQLHFLQKIKQIVKNVLSGIMSFKNMKNKKGFIIHTLLIWSMYFGMILIGFQSIEQTSGLGVNATFSVLSFGSVGMIVTPGGLGAYTGLVEKIVSLYGIDKAISVAISWIIWLVPTLIIILGGGISLILLPFYNRLKNAQ